jgi:hypothetical protein
MALFSESHGCKSVLSDMRLGCVIAKKAMVIRFGLEKNLVLEKIYPGFSCRSSFPGKGIASY